MPCCGRRDAELLASPFQLGAHRPEGLPVDVEQEVAVGAAVRPRAGPWRVRDDHVALAGVPEESLADSCAPAALAALKCTEVHATVTVLLPDTQESRRLCITLPRASWPQSRGYGRSRKRLLPPRSDRSMNAELRSSRAPAHRGSFPKT